MFDFYFELFSTVFVVAAVCLLSGWRRTQLVPRSLKGTMPCL